MLAGIVSSAPVTLEIARPAALQGKLLYIANSLVDQHIGLEETDDGVWSIYFNSVLLGTLDERDYIIRG